MVLTTCFIIGPMNDALLNRQARLRRLADEIIRPLLQEEDWVLRVITPYDIDGVGLIMDNVIAAIDHADLVIADLTDNNPNVFYELAIAHSLGRPTIMVKEDDGSNISFDVRAFSYIRIDLTNRERSINSLRQPVRTIKRQSENFAIQSNPVTNFYRNPITNISPATGLAQGFYENFVEPAGMGLIALNPSTSDYLNPLHIQDNVVTERNNVNLNIIIPSELKYTRRDRIEQVKGKLDLAEIKVGHRKLTVLAKQEGNTYQLYDIPSTMNTMMLAINKRANQIQARQDSEEWKQLEEQEISRFYSALKILVEDSTNDTFRERVKITLLNTQTRDPKLDWLYKIWNL
jgi:hypothetical protein